MHTSALERRYRRLLAWYPAAHRLAYGDEMIGVLLTSARDGQRRPSLPDALDLALGGLRIRLRPFLTGRFGPSFADALAVFSLAVPAIWLIVLGVLETTTAYHAVSHGETVRPSMYLLLAVPVLLAILTIVPIVLAWRGKRVAAAVVAFIPAALYTALAFAPPTNNPAAFGSFDSLLAVLQVVALAISPGPRRGAQVMTARTWAVVGATGLAMSVPLVPGLVRLPVGTGAAIFAGVAVAAAAGLMVTLPAAVAARLIGLAAAPAYLAGVSIATAYFEVRNPLVSLSYAIVYLPALAIAVLTGVLGWLGTRRKLTPAP